MGHTERNDDEFDGCRTGDATVETAEGYYQEASSLASELGMFPLVAHCHLDLGKLFRKSEQ